MGEEDHSRPTAPSPVRPLGERYRELRGRGPRTNYGNYRQQHLGLGDGELDAAHEVAREQREHERDEAARHVRVEHALVHGRPPGYG